MRKFFRALSQLLEQFFSFARRIRIKLLYPGVTIKNCRIEKNCKIVCSVGATLELINCNISAGTQIVAATGSTLKITDTFIGRNCVIVSRDSITIKEHCQIAEMVVIRDQNHNYGNTTKPLSAQGFTTNPIHINRNVWIGAKSTVLAGTKVGENTVLAAHSVARHDIDPNCLYGGIPAKKIKSF